MPQRENLVRKHIWGIVMLVALALLSALAVKHYKKPGQMTVIESQAMDMSAMKPPLGSVPVATEIVSRTSFSSKVRYTGTVAAFNEQNISSRVAGYLTGLKVYNGDKVSAGQLLAILDSPDAQSKLAEATYGQIAAAREIPVAQSNLARMRAEKSAANGEIQTAKREVEGAKARLASSGKMVAQAQQDLKSSQASLNYWKVEFKRQSNLLKAGAVSQQEYDSEQAQYTAAEADVANKQAKLEQARADVDAMRADVESKKSMVNIARDRAIAAEAALSGASGEVSMKQASASMAGAARSTAAAFNQYRFIRAPFSGVVTKRFLSPGVLVNPGTPILNVAQIDKVRLQANVAEQDLGSISVGSEVIATTLKGSKKTIRAVVTSVSPAADSTSHTSIVEAIVDNSNHALFPGDFVSMEISTGKSVDAITVPTSALTTKNGRDAVWVTQCMTIKGGKTTYYCTMHPEVTSDKPGICPKCNMNLEPKSAQTGKTAKLVYVTLGRTDGDRTEIISGLSEGDEVIYKGNRYLREGDTITPTQWGADNVPTELPKPAGGGAMESMPGMDMSGDKSMPGMKK